MSALTEDQTQRSWNPIRRGRHDGRIVLLKVCAGPCGRELVCSPIPEESSFALNGYGPNGTRRWKPLCKTCYRDYQRDYRVKNGEHLRANARAAHAARMQDPEYAARLRVQWRETKGRLVRDPEWKTRTREYARLWKARRRAEQPERVNEDQRMYYALRRDREGKTVNHRWTVIDGTQPRIPAAPFRRWILSYAELAELEGNVHALARDLGIEPRRVSSLYAEEYDRVALDVVSRALTNARFIVHLDGRAIVTVDDLYEEEAA